MLPSEVLARADTLDYLVMDIAQTWQQHQREIAEAKAKGLPPPAPALSVNTMQEMIERVRG